ncbi:hypothetical protein Agub_g12797, partial [Astrephomene gubernaculifera]
GAGAGAAEAAAGAGGGGGAGGGACRGAAGRCVEMLEGVALQLMRLLGGTLYEASRGSILAGFPSARSAVLWLLHTQALLAAVPWDPAVLASSACEVRTYNVRQQRLGPGPGPQVPAGGPLGSRRMQQVTLAAPRVRGAADLAHVRPEVHRSTGRLLIPQRSRQRILKLLAAARPGQIVCTALVKTAFASETNATASVASPVGSAAFSPTGGAGGTIPGVAAAAAAATAAAAAAGGGGGVPPGGMPPGAAAHLRLHAAAMAGIGSPPLPASRFKRAALSFPRHASSPPSMIVASQLASAILPPPATEAGAAATDPGDVGRMEATGVPPQQPAPPPVDMVVAAAAAASPMLVPTAMAAVTAIPPDAASIARSSGPSTLASILRSQAMWEGADASDGEDGDDVGVGHRMEVGGREVECRVDGGAAATSAEGEGGPAAAVPEIRVGAASGAEAEAEMGGAEMAAAASSVSNVNTTAESLAGVQGHTTAASCSQSVKKSAAAAAVAAAATAPVRSRSRGGVGGGVFEIEAAASAANSFTSLYSNNSETTSAHPFASATATAAAATAATASNPLLKLLIRRENNIGGLGDGASLSAAIMNLRGMEAVRFVEHGRKVLERLGLLVPPPPPPPPPQPVGGLVAGRTGATRRHSLFAPAAAAVAGLLKTPARWPVRFLGSSASHQERQGSSEGGESGRDRLAFAAEGSVGPRGSLARLQQLVQRTGSRPNSWLMSSPRAGASVTATPDGAGGGKTSAGGGGGGKKRLRRSASADRRRNSVISGVEGRERYGGNGSVRDGYGSTTAGSTGFGVAASIAARCRSVIMPFERRDLRRLRLSQEASTRPSNTAPSPPHASASAGAPASAAAAAPAAGVDAAAGAAAAMAEDLCDTLTGLDRSSTGPAHLRLLSWAIPALLNRPRSGLFQERPLSATSVTSGAHVTPAGVDAAAAERRRGRLYSFLAGGSSGGGVREQALLAANLTPPPPPPPLGLSGGAAGGSRHTASGGNRGGLLSDKSYIKPQQLLLLQQQQQLPVQPHQQLQQQQQQQLTGRRRWRVSSTLGYGTSRQGGRLRTAAGSDEGAAATPPVSAIAEITHIDIEHGLGPQAQRRHPSLSSLRELLDMTALRRHHSAVVVASAGGGGGGGGSAEAAAPTLYSPSRLRLPDSLRHATSSRSTDGDSDADSDADGDGDGDAGGGGDRGGGSQRRTIAGMLSAGWSRFVGSGSHPRPPLHHHLLLMHHQQQQQPQPHPHPQQQLPTHPHRHHHPALPSPGQTSTSSGVCPHPGGPDVDIDVEAVTPRTPGPGSPAPLRGTPTRSGGVPAGLGPPHAREGCVAALSRLSVSAGPEGLRLAGVPRAVREAAGETERLLAAPSLYALGIHENHENHENHGQAVDARGTEHGGGGAGAGVGVVRAAGGVGGRGHEEGGAAQQTLVFVRVPPPLSECPHAAEVLQELQATVVRLVRLEQCDPRVTASLGCGVYICTLETTNIFGLSAYSSDATDAEEGDASGGGEATDVAGRGAFFDLRRWMGRKPAGAGMSRLSVAYGRRNTMVY